MENKITRKADLSLQEFCDMDQLYRLLDNWSKSSGMSAVIVDNEGNRTSESFGMTEFCKMVHDNKQGMISCSSLWKEQHETICCVFNLQKRGFSCKISKINLISSITKMQKGDTTWKV